MMDSATRPTTLEQFRQIVYQAAKTRYRHISNASVEKELIDFEIEVFSSIPFTADIICRTLTSYQEAWIKAHYRDEFQMARRIIARRRKLANKRSDDIFNQL